tara:strand:+ start:10879 stop:12432 length:1554 start_codon:yes stop_codon:yes gene_type:complete
MAQQLKSINLVAPAFKGVNTEDSPIAQDPSFAEVADNAVIDQRGRIAARKGLSVTTTNKTQLGSGKVTAIKEFKNDAGTTKIFSIGNNKILSGTTTLADETPGGYSISANDWKMVNFNDSIYFFQRSYQPLIYNTVASGTSGGANSNVVTLSSVNSAAGLTSAMYGNEVLAAYGRLWTADFSTDKSTIYWSDLLSGHIWTGGSSGSIDISKVWPDGHDEIVALAAHNDYLIIFGKRSIVVYSGADAPASMALADTVSGIGCVGRDTVQNTGTDLIFLSHMGLKSFGRTIQEKSMPINNLSGTITKDIIALIVSETEFFKSAYFPEENFYLLTFTGFNTTFCFDIRTTLPENGSYRVTRWPGTGFTCYDRKANGTLLIGGSHGVGLYSGYLDNGQTYRFQYTSPELTFGDITKLKFVKKLRPVLIGASGASIYIKWSYDFKSSSGSSFIDLSTQAIAYFNESEFNIGQFSAGELVTTKLGVNANGSGNSVSINMEADINGDELSLQEINVLTLLGKTL